jgi:capsid protein
MIGYLKNLLFVTQLFFSSLVGNRYEAGVRWGSSRSQIPGFVQDARFDADQATREEIVRKARYFERNNAIVNRLADLFEQFTVGANGLQFIPSSSDEEWNQRAKQSYEEWCDVCDLTSLHHISTNQTLSARSWFIDGQVFILLTRGQNAAPTSNLQPTTRPRIQLIETHRISTPSTMHELEGKTIHGGIEVDANGRPIAYWIRNSNGDLGTEESYVRRKAEDVIHIGEPSRIGMYHSLSFFYPVLNDIHDLDDLQMLEMRAAMDAAEKSTVYKTLSGEVPNTANMRRDKFTQTTQTSAGTDTAETKAKAVKTALGGRSFAIRVGEEVEQFQNSRPTVTTQQYWDYLTSKVCAGVGISKLLVLPFTVQGTVARADFDIANAFFRSRSAVLIAAWTRVYLFYMEWAIRNDRRLVDPPADWRSVDTRAPRSVNVDVGRNSSAMIAELKAGLRTFQSCYAELGLDWRTELDQRAKEAAFVRKLSEKYKVTPAEITEAATAAMEEQAANDPAPGSEPSATDELKAEIEAYGIAVRAGAVTPTIDDENYFRKKAGLPAITADVKRAWSEDDGVRRPITLAMPGQVMDAPKLAAATQGEA